MELIDPNKPTQAEQVEQQVQAGKLNLAVALMQALVSNSDYAASEVKPEQLANYAIRAADAVFEHFRPKSRLS